MTKDSGFKFSKRSLDNLQGVNGNLVDVVHLALKYSEIDFVVTEGLRSKERQEQLVKDGKSRTMNSRHLTGHAVDVAALVNGKVSWEWEYYEKIADAFFQAAAELKVPIVWGGSWKTFKDGVHFELNKNFFK